MDVLVVSSQRSFLAQGLKALKEEGYTPHIQHTVEEAVAASRSMTPSLVILDAKSVPGSLVSTCQALHGTSAAPVILVSPEPIPEEEAAACFDAGLGARLLRWTSPTLLLAWTRALTRGG